MKKQKSCAGPVRMKKPTSWVGPVESLGTRKRAGQREILGHLGDHINIERQFMEGESWLYNKVNGSWMDPMADSSFSFVKGSGVISVFILIQQIYFII